MNGLQANTIEYFAARHSYNNKWHSPIPISRMEDEAAAQAAIDWGCDVLPEGLELIESIDDGDSHDVSSVKYWRTADGHAIYSYNNNAWGHCDVLSPQEDPGAIGAWLSLWDEIPEEWLKNYVEE